MNLAAYLERIRYAGPPAPGARTLADLHLAHLLAVPFENLDIHLGRAIALDEEALYDKIVRRRRGGFCYELNGLFAALLREAGFPVTLLSAGVAHEEGGFGPEFDHLLLLVPLDPPRIADVGFGEGFRRPLILEDGLDQPQDGSLYRLEHGESWTLLRDGKPQYRFTATPRRLEEFGPRCLYHQTSPQSSFTQVRLCTLATPEGRITISGMRLITTGNSGKRERFLANDAELRAVLRESFGVELTRNSTADERR